MLGYLEIIIDVYRPIIDLYKELFKVIKKYFNKKDLQIEDYSKDYDKQNDILKMMYANTNTPKPPFKPTPRPKPPAIRRVKG